MKQLATAWLPALLLATTAAAQTTFSLGVRGGANLARTTVDPASNYRTLAGSQATTKAAIYAWQTGLASEVAFGKLALQPALMFSQKGERMRVTTSYIGVVRTDVYTLVSTIRTNWLELPLNLVYTRHGDHGLQVFAGPYVALAVGGRQHVANSFTSLTLSPQQTDTTSRISYGPGTGNRRFDAGLNFGLGYRQGPVQVQLSYGLGLVNLHSEAVDYFAGPTAHQPYAAYNRAAQLTGTYFFKL